MYTDNFLGERRIFFEAPSSSILSIPLEAYFIFQR